MNDQVKAWAIAANPASQQIYDVKDSWPYNCAAWSGEELDKFSRLVIEHVLDEIYHAPVAHCALTTYDLSVANCARDKITQYIKNKYNIKNKFKGDFNG